MTEQGRRRRGVPLYLLLGCLAVIATWVAVATRWVPFGVPGQWVWRPQLLAPLLLTGEAAAALMASLVVAASVAALALLKPQLRRTHVAASLVALATASLCLCLALVSMEPPIPDAFRALRGADPWHRPARERLAINIGAIMFSDVAFAYYSEAAQISDVGEFLRNYEQRIRAPETPQRVQTHPAGAVLVPWLLRKGAHGIGGKALLQAAMGPEPWKSTVHFLRRATGRWLSEDECAAALMVALVLIAFGPGLCLPTYLLARQVGNRQRALMSAAMVTFVPSSLLFVPGIDQLVALLGALALWLFCLGMRGGRVWALAGAGVLLALDCFISIGAGSLAVLAAVIALAPVVALWKRKQARRRAARRAAVGIGILLAGLLLPLMTLWPVCGYNAFEVALTAAAQQRAIVVEQWQRTYSAWLMLNLVDFAVFLGPCVAVCAVSWLVGRLRRWDAGRAVLRSDFLLVAFAVTLALVDLSGSARAEVGRIWMLLMPCACILAARRVGNHPHTHASLFAFVVVVLQVLHTVVLQQNLDVMTPQ